MKYILILMLSLYTVGAASQARVGYHISAVQKDFPLIKKTADMTYSWDTENAHVKYITDSLGFVSETIIYPFTKRDESIYMAFYNRSFTKTSASSWVFTDDKTRDTAFITKVRKGDGISSYFIWSFNKGALPIYEKIY